MRFAYRLGEPDERVTEIARKIVALLVENGLTYKTASETLETAQTLLEETRPSTS